MRVQAVCGPALHPRFEGNRVVFMLAGESVPIVLRQGEFVVKTWWMDRPHVCGTAVEVFEIAKRDSRRP